MDIAKIALSMVMKWPSKEVRFIILIHLLQAFFMEIFFLFLISRKSHWVPFGPIEHVLSIS